jgi:uncharacterized membrane protein
MTGRVRQLLGWVQSALVSYELVVVAAVTLVYFVTYCGLSVLRHVTYHSFGPDLGLFDQIFWNTSHGRFFESTMSLGLARPHSYLGDHFSLIYLALLPFYALVPHPETLVVLQTAFLALGVLPIYLLARLILAPGFSRLAWVVAYFLFLPLAFINLYDFHELALVVLPLGLALYFLERRQTALFLLCLLVTFFIKEELPLVGAGFGLYVLLEKRDAKLGLGVLVGSTVAFLLLLRVVIPAFGGGSYVYIASRYGQLGDSPQQILVTAITKPRRLAQTLFQAEKLKFLTAIFGPVIGLTLASGFGVLLVVPTLAILLLSNYQPQFSFTKQYSAPLIPLVLGTSILGLARFKPGSQRLATGAVLLSSLAFSVFLGDLPFSRHFEPRSFETEPRYVAFAPNLSRIPPDASVAAENDLTPHLSQRRFVYDIEFEGPQNAQYLALDDAARGRSEQALQREIASFELQGYRLIASGDGLALMQRP